MKIGKLIIQEKRIIENKPTSFIGLYKNRKIRVTSEHSYGRAMYYSQTRFDIIVEEEQTGDTILSILYDCNSLKDAIKYAIKETEK